MSLFEINDLTVNPFTIPHDAAQPVGYRVECGEHSVGIATDLGKYNEYIVGNLQNLDALLLEANHDIPYAAGWKISLLSETENPWRQGTSFQ